MSQSDDEAQTPVDTSGLQAGMPQGAMSGAHDGESVRAGMEPLVTILTFCAHPALAYGTLLIFKTVRVGFPNARIEVFDNGSHPDVRAKIEQAAAGVGASFEAMTPRHYADHYRWLLLEREHDRRPLVILDPDVILWECVEHWRFGDALLAGRLMPKLGNGPMIGQPRLHPSMLWVPNVERLRSEVARLNAHVDLIGQRAEMVAGQMHTYDTVAGLYQAIRDQCTPFDEEHLDCYDHLFWGSHLALLDPGMGPSFDVFREGHRAAAEGDLRKVRGIWRRQQQFFEVNPVFRAQPGEPLSSLKTIQGWQDLRFSDDQLLDGFADVLKGIGRPMAQRPLAQ